MSVSELRNHPRSPQVLHLPLKEEKMVFLNTDLGISSM